MNDRKQKVETLLREAIASFVLTEANPNPLITITRVEISHDQGKANVFFTTIPEEREQDALIFLKRSGSDVRSHIKKKTRLKIIPSLKFEIDGNERLRQHEEGSLGI